MEKTKVSVLMSIYSKEKAEYFRKSLNITRLVSNLWGSRKSSRNISRNIP